MVRLGSCVDDEGRLDAPVLIAEFLVQAVCILRRIGASECHPEEISQVDVFRREER